MMTSGHIRVWTIERGRWRLACNQHNDIMTIAKAQIADLVRGHPQSSALRAFAVGSSATAVSTDQTQLVAEVTRKSVPPAETNTVQQKNIRVGTELTIRQVFGPGLDFVLRELALFGDIVEIVNPTSAPIVTPSASGGFLTAGVYTVVYTWTNGNGETQASPAALATITGTTGSIAVIVPARPAQASSTRVFAAPSGPPLLSGTTTMTAYEITAFPVGAEPPASNTSAIPGPPNAGRMVNRVVVDDQTILTSTVFVAESVLVFS